MSSLYRSLFLAAAVFWLAAAGAVWAPAQAHASEPPVPGGWLPDPDNLEELGSRIASFSAESFARQSERGEAGARSCALEGDTFSCEGVELSFADVTLRARHIERGRGVVRATGVRAQVGSEAYRVEEWRASDEGYSLQGATVRRQDARLQTFRGTSATLWVATGALEFTVLRWLDEPTGPPVITAERASFDGKRWRVDGFDVVGLPPYLADFEADTAGPVSGFLPPRALWSHDTVDLQTSYLIAPWRVAPLAVVAPGRWYGLGLGLLGQRNLSSPDEPATLDLQLRWSPDAGRVSPVAVGDAVWGEPYTHASASAEAMGDEAFWETERLARGALFRPWRLSRLGVSLSGSDHYLRLGVVHSESFEARNRGEPVDGPESLVGARLELATTHELAYSVRADLGVGHVSFFDADDGQHVTTLRTGAERTFGSRGAVFARPALRGLLQTGLGSEGPGLGVQTTAQLLGSIDAGLGLRGRFSGFEHRLEPAVVLVREIAGFSRRSSASQPSPGQMRREPAWTLAGVRLDQSLEFGGPWSVDLPLAILYEGDGFREAVERRPWGLASLRSAGLSPGETHLELSAHAACEQLCETLLWSTGAYLEWDTIELSYAAGDVQNEAHRPLLWRSSLRDGWSLIEGFQGLDASDRGRSLAQLGEARWRRGRYALSGRVFWDAEDGGEHDEVGLSVGNTYAFEELGWTVGVEAGWTNREQRNRSRRDDWGLLVGLTHRR